MVSCEKPNYLSQHSTPVNSECADGEHQKGTSQQLSVLTEQIAELRSIIDRAKTSRHKELLAVVMEKSALRATILLERRRKG